jgi:hypothetical protein
MASIGFSGDTSGLISVTAPLVAGSGVLTLPTGTDTLIGKATTDTLTNKSIAATQLTGTIAAAALPAGSVLQVVNSQTGAFASGTTQMPLDNTIPQITEGFQVLSLAITPISATSKLLFNVNVQVVPQTAAWVGAALFQGATANAIAATGSYWAAGGGVVPFNHFMVSGTTSSTTFTVRVGLNAAGTLYINGAPYWGGVANTSITITEIAA